MNLRIGLFSRLRLGAAGIIIKLVVVRYLVQRVPPRHNLHCQFYQHLVEL